MAKNISTKFYANAVATCANCGSVYNLRADREAFSLEICGNCHPYYTGNETVIDTSGRIDKFKARMEIKPVEKKDKKVKNRRQVLSLADLNSEEAPVTAVTPVASVTE
jgi:large subunit ribosomal protein L31